MALFLIPVGYWLVGLGSAAVATVVTANVDDTAQGLADATATAAKPLNKLLTTTALIGAGYAAYKHRAALAKFIGAK